MKASTSWKVEEIGKKIAKVMEKMRPETDSVIATNMEEELYKNLINDVTVKVNPELEIRPTLIQSFSREVSLIFRKDGKITKQWFPSVQLAKDFCSESFTTQPLLFEHGYVLGKNGYEVNDLDISKIK